MHLFLYWCHVIKLTVSVLQSPELDNNQKRCEMVLLILYLNSLISLPTAAYPGGKNSFIKTEA